MASSQRLIPCQNYINETETNCQGLAAGEEQKMSASPSNCQGLLLNALKVFNVDQEKEVRRLIADGADAKHLYGKDKRTTLHVLYDAFFVSEEDCETKERVCEKTAKSLIQLGANPHARDGYDRSVLHAAVANVCPIFALLNANVPINESDAQESSVGHPHRTVLHTLFSSGRSFSAKYVENLVDMGASLEENFFDLGTPLDMMAEIKDNGKALICLVERKWPQMLEKHGGSMLVHAVKSGSLETVDKLMKYEKRVAPLILLAVSADFMPYEKYKHFQSENANLRDSNGKNLVHYSAQYHHPRIMTEAVMRGVPFDEEDNGGNLPLHFSCRSDDVESIECLSFLIEAGSSVTAKNKKGQSSLFFALQGRAVKCAGILLKAGASLRHSKLKTLKYDEVTLLADVEVILQAPKHKQIERVLQAGAVFSGCAKYDDEHRRELISLSESMQMTAVDMMEAREWTVSDISNDLFLYGLAKEQKVFISCSIVQNKLKAAWHGKRGGLKTWKYVPKVFLFWMTAFIHPFAFVSLQHCTRCYERLENMTEEPCVSYIAYVTSYLFFIVLLIANASLKSSSDFPATTPSDLDWIILIFVVSLVLREVDHAISHGNQIKSYLKNWTIIFDVCLLLVFVVYYFLLIVGYFSSAFNAVRASFHVFGLASLMSSIRFLPYLQAQSVLGPIQISFFRLFSDVLYFLVILGTFLIGFAVSITSVYSASAKSLGAPANATVPVAVAGMGPSLTILFWSLFGLVDLVSFEAEQSTETAVGLILLALWLILAVIVLLNMLIALISNTFQSVQNNADTEWKFARAVVIHDITKAPPIPIPINILHLLVRVIRLCKKAPERCCRCSQEAISLPVHEKETNRQLEEDNLSDDEDAKKRREARYKRARAEEVVRRKDLYELWDHIDDEIESLEATIQLNAQPSSTVAPLPSFSQLAHNICRRRSKNPKRHYVKLFDRNMKVRIHRTLTKKPLPQKMSSDDSRSSLPKRQFKSYDDRSNFNAVVPSAVTEEIDTVQKSIQQLQEKCQELHSSFLKVKGQVASMDALILLESNK